VRRNLPTSNASIAFEIKIDEHLHLSQVNGNRGEMLIQLPINRNAVLSSIVTVRRLSIPTAHGLKRGSPHLKSACLRKCE
jgi:hypothetical protein